jgi:hypothetical protein
MMDMTREMIPKTTVTMVFSSMMFVEEATATQGVVLE